MSQSFGQAVSPMTAYRIMAQATWVSILLLSLVPYVAAQGFFPCHRGREFQGVGVSCEKVRLPRKLCTACKLKPFGENGDFLSCRSIYDLDDPACRTELKLYSRFNRHCDPLRAIQTKDITRFKEPLDYFIYSVCEECCDCVPFGAKPEQFQERRKKGTLFSANRGNCPAHAFFDICRIWPEVRYVTLGGGQPQPWRKKVCPLLKEWINSPDGDNWLERRFVPLRREITSFLNQFLRVAKCRNNQMWKACTALEAAQNRLE